MFIGACRGSTLYHANPGGLLQLTFHSSERTEGSGDLRS
jgi:hypothetical protein